jgi:ABC-type siderophore export system fused ATPase/permease subunit
MLLPIVGFLVASVLLTLAGTVLLWLLPAFRFTFASIAVFVMSAFVGCALIASTTARFLIQSNGDAATSMAFVLQLAIVLMSSIGGGLSGVWLFQRSVSRIRQRKGLPPAEDWKG